MRATVPTLPAAFEPLGGIVSADATRTNEDVARTRRYLTVEVAEHLSATADRVAIEDQERAAVERSVDAQFPAVAAFLAADIERPSAHVVEPDAPGHFPWCAPGGCVERRYGSGEAFVEHASAPATLPVPDGMAGEGALLSAELYASSDYDGATLGFSVGGEGVALEPAGAARVIDSVSRFLERMRALHAQMLEDASPKVTSWVRDLEAYVEGAPDPQAAYEEVASAIRSQRRCAAYAWCTERGEHDHHMGASVSVTAPGEQRSYVDAWPQAFEPGTEFIGFVDSDLTPEQARQEAAKLRSFADQLEALADTVGGGR